VPPNPRVQRTRVARCARPGSAEPQPVRRQSEGQLGVIWESDSRALQLKQAALEVTTGSARSRPAMGRTH